MHHYAYLTAVYWLASHYHSGQWSKGYRLMCIAQERQRQHHAGAALYRTVEQLQNDQLYTKHSDFRRVVAYYMHRLRKYRFKL